MPDAIRQTAVAVLEAFRAAGIMASTAESCTGGMVAAALTDIAGSSAVFDRGFVTYSNAAKIELLGVDPALLERHGAVSAEVAAAMAEGALTRSQAAVAVAITGIAGPDGGTADKPVGLVWFGLAASNGTSTEMMLFAGDRDAVRRQATERALSFLLHGVSGLGGG